MWTSNLQDIQNLVHKYSATSRFIKGLPEKKRIIHTQNMDMDTVTVLILRSRKPRRYWTSHLRDLTQSPVLRRESVGAWPGELSGGNIFHKVGKKMASLPCVFGRGH